MSDLVDMLDSVDTTTMMRKYMQIATKYITVDEEREVDGEGDGEGEGESEKKKRKKNERL